MKQFRLDEWGQLQIPSEEEMDNFSKDDRWTVRAGFAIAAAVLTLAAVVFDKFYNH